MEVLIAVGYATLSLFAGIVWLWSGITLSPYVQERKSAVVAFTFFWVFNPDWFTKEGQATFRKERKRFVSVMALVVVLLFGSVKLYG